ncbi:hypothetical protein MHM88_14605 [Epibacterium sp. MM17-32]|uniref:hypothetical protein n=1 Tax=Epibacterium sp. MM17-32 TaxID=2917734 RepID=UPI001EF60537|nr:hypothetical protein [Epibacterium sp. MM17-32]MCG7629039.1 hypothetical protein [Epibacterium sp. MM17-32]
MEVRLNGAVVPKNEAPMMFHEQIAFGSVGEEEFVVRRGVNSLHMQIEMGDQVVTFNIADMIEPVVRQLGGEE